MRASDQVRYALAVVVILVALVGPTTTDSRTVEVASNAVRGVAWEADSVDGCDLETVAALADERPEVEQFIVTATIEFDAPVGDTFVATLRDDEWICQTERLPTRLGENGTQPLEERRFGDGTTPAGIFPLGEIEAWDRQRLNAFGNEPDPGTRSGLTYRDVQPADCWGSTPGDDDYNRLVEREGCEPPDEWLPGFEDMYAHAVIIGANLDPETGETSGDDEDEPAYAAATFLHHHRFHEDGRSRPTAVGASLDLDDLQDVIRLIDPELDPHFAIGPTDWLRGLD